MTLCGHIGKHTNSFLQDMMKGRPSEVHYMNGLVAAKGREAGIPTPFNDEITRIVEQIEKGEMTFGPEHLKQLEDLVPFPTSRCRQGLRLREVRKDHPAICRWVRQGKRSIFRSHRKVVAVTGCKV